MAQSMLLAWQIPGRTKEKHMETSPGTVGPGAKSRTRNQDIKWECQPYGSDATDFDRLQHFTDVYPGMWC
jgi:hypothetical protein